MYPIPAVPRLVTRLVDSATVAARTNGEFCRPATMLIESLKKRLRESFWCPAGDRVQPAWSLPT